MGNPNSTTVPATRRSTLLASAAAPTEAVVANAPAAAPRPRFAPINRAVALFGPSRSSLYRMAADQPELFRKFGRTTLVDCDLLERLILASPAGVSRG